MEDISGGMQMTQNTLISSGGNKRFRTPVLLSLHQSVNIRVIRVISVPAVLRRTRITTDAAMGTEDISGRMQMTQNTLISSVGNI
jgi:hypothetical protein